MKLGVQLWSVRNEANKDFRETAIKLKEMGYDGVEIAGIESIDYEEMSEILKDVGLEAFSAHIVQEEIEDSSKLSKLKKLGVSYVAFNGLPASPDKMDYLHERMTYLGKIAKKENIYLLYHNHDRELKKYDEKIGLDMLYDGIDADVFGAELDVCWLSYAGIDPVEYVKKYKGRCPVVHLKDYVGSKTTDDFSFKTVGRGLIKVDDVIRAAQYSGAKWLVVEQDEPENGWTAMDSVAESARFILEESIYNK